MCGLGTADVQLYCGEPSRCRVCGRGPALGGVCLGKPTDSSETLDFVPMSARQSVRCLLIMAGSLGRIEREGSHQERSENSILIKRNRYRSANFCPFLVHADRRR